MSKGSLALARLVLDQIPAGTRQVLELGCGAGKLTCELAKKAMNVLGVDTDRHAIEQAKIHFSKEDNVTFCVGDSEQLDDAINGLSFDCIVCVLSLHELNIVTALENMKRHLRSSGRIIIVDLYANRRSSFASTLLDQLCLSQLNQIVALTRTIKEIGFRNVSSFLLWRCEFAASRAGWRHMRQDYERRRPPSLNEWRSVLHAILPSGAERVVMGSVLMYSWTNQ